MSRPSARESIALMAGYHSPQIDVDVRLNTNESPEPPPEGFADAVAARVSEIAWHRYPQRSASELRSRIGANYGLDASQVFAANGSNEVLQTLLLTFAGPGRSAADTLFEWDDQTAMTALVGADFQKLRCNHPVESRPVEPVI